MDIKQSKISIAVIYLSALLIILSMGTVYDHMGLGLHLSGIFNYLPCALLLFVAIADGNMRGRDLAITLSICFGLLFVAFLNGSSKIRTLPEIMSVFCIMFYSKAVEKGKQKFFLLRCISNILFIIALISLFFYIFGPTLHFIKPNGTVSVFWGYEQDVKNYYYIHFEREEAYLFGRWFACNRSIFVERAFASFAFFVGFAYEAFIREKKKIFRIIVFTAVIVSTFSITGLMALTASLLIILFLSKRKRAFGKILKIISLPVLLAIGVYIVFALFQTKNEMGHSLESRMTDFALGFQYFLEKPLFGYGYGVEFSDTYSPYSNAVMQILVRGGIALAALYCYPLFNTLHYWVKTKNNSFFLFTLIIFVSLVFTAVGYTKIVYVILISSGGIRRKDGEVSSKNICYCTDLQPRIIPRSVL